MKFHSGCIFSGYTAGAKILERWQLIKYILTRKTFFDILYAKLEFYV